ncbi:aldo/keto reductase [Aestuariirhabdus litorea]|uniref:Aldo/keto reductase n=1 Tax=Aestuariirhabdus litorea TaxID=2528527 RepID=A0A3P3VI50_9GAMM|nr:aldo/keto reductase [Aestuariirhabdus litorea]RRJ82342.1 aldo/keto reductase [Aestuariirhabdus litorea]RWW92507.1 aldo/keto reductase [Endozoicomonadaceae bacterium GTF-13]
MITSAIADTGVEVTPLGFGTVKLGRNEGVKYPQGFRIPDDRQALELINLAADLGINLIDTAPAYGTSEERLGTLLSGQRSRWVICTKVGEEFEQGVSRFDFSPEHTRFSIERSLKRLNTDYLDLVLVHSDGNDQAIVDQHGTLEVLADLKRQGLIRATGISSKTVAGGIAALAHCDCAMVTYNLVEPQEGEVIDFAHQHHKGILIKKALASGHLCQQGEDPVARSMEFVFARPGVCSAIVGTINPDHLKSNLAAALKALGQ